MDDLVQVVMALASETWMVLITGFAIVLALTLLAYTIRATLAVGMGSGSSLGEAAIGLIGPLAVALFLFLGVPPLLKAMTKITSCTGTFNDLTLWAQRLLVVLMAFRMLKIGYLAVVAEAIGAGEAVAMLLNEAAAIIAAMLFIPFIGGVASTLLGCY